MWLLDKLMNKKKIPEPPEPGIEKVNVDLDEKIELPETISQLPPVQNVEPKIASVSTEIIEDPMKDTFNMNPIKHEVHFEKQVGSKIKNYFFIEKIEYSDLLVEISDLDFVLKEMVEETPEFVEIKKEEDQIANEFRSVMEDVEKKLIFVDKTLFGA